MGPGYWVRVAGIAAATGVVIALPTRLLPNGWFTRMTPVRPQDYLFLVATAALTGMVLGLPKAVSGSEGAAFGGGIATVLAVGCPICNKVVVALLGVGGAMTWFAPLQPLLGAASVVLLLMTLRLRLSRPLDRCELPVRAGSAPQRPQ